MRISLSQIICIGATGIMALGVHAQTPSTGASTPLKNDGSSASAPTQAEYQAAVKACKGTIGSERTNCLRYELTRNGTSDSSPGSSGGLSAASRGGPSGQKHVTE